MKSPSRQLGQNIPHKVRRLPIVRNIPWLQYSKEMDVEERLRDLQSVFPVLRSTDDVIEYKNTYIMAMSARVGSTALIEWLQIAGLSDFHIREIFNNRG